MGSFFWTDRPYSFRQKNNAAIHYLRWLEYKKNRLEIYKSGGRIIGLFLKAFRMMNDITMRNYKDGIGKFEKKILGGILYSHFKGEFSFRGYYVKKLSSVMRQIRIRLVKNTRGEGNPHKIILVAKNQIVAKDFRNYLGEKSIYFINGYKLLRKDDDKLPVASSVDTLIFEIPIEDDELKMKWLINTIVEFDNDAVTK